MLVRPRLVVAGAAPPAVSAPTSAYALGSVVGVPTGTSLTATSGSGTNDGSIGLTINDAVNSDTNTKTATIFYRRKWVGTPTPVPAFNATWLFDECEFDISSDNMCIDLDAAQGNGSASFVNPLFYFRKCTFKGNSTTGKAVVGGYAYFEDCDMRGCEDGIAGAYWTTVKHCNVIADTDGQPDPHSDAIQNAGTGKLKVYNCWLDGGQDPASANAALRVGTEFSACADIDVRYNGIAGVAHALQFRGDAGAGDITNVTVIGNRWVNQQLYGPHDFQETTGVTWSDNAYIGGAVINYP